jgi:hypothetical protein
MVGGGGVGVQRNAATEQQSRPDSLQGVRVALPYICQPFFSLCLDVQRLLYPETLSQKRPVTGWKQKPAAWKHSDVYSVRNSSNFIQKYFREFMLTIFNYL